MNSASPLVLQFRPDEFAQLHWNTQGPSGLLGGYQRHENWLLENTDKTTLQCTLDPVRLERTLRYVGPRYGSGGPNKRLRLACIPGLRRAEMERASSAAPKPEYTTTGERRMRTEVMDITPAQAEELLKLNRTNRPVRKAWVKAIVAIIERGEWKLTHQGIALSVSGDLLDGQHRLQAVVDSGITVPMLVAFDCDPGTFTVLDAGARRSLSDHMRVSTADAATTIMVHTLMQTAKRTAYGAGGLSTATVAPVMELFGDEIRAVCAIRGKFCSSPIRAAIIAHMLDGRPDALDQFGTLNAMEFDLMAPAVQSLVRQVIDGNLIKRDLHALAGRAWRAFHPDYSQNGKLTIKDMSVPLRELREVFLTAQVRREKQEAPVWNESRPPSDRRTQRALAGARRGRDRVGHAHAVDDVPRGGALPGGAGAQRT